MPIYQWYCPTCEETAETVASVEDRNKNPPSHCGQRMERLITAAHVNPDIQPYRAVAGDRAGQMITSRKEHKEFLKRNRFTEVGNEPIKPIKNDFRPRRGEIAEELKRVVPQVIRR